ncbi:MAG: LytR/AlgR family response regulator transcription factor [Bacteroidota bacterium]
MLQCLVIDEDPSGRSVLEQFISQMPELTLLQSCEEIITALEVLQSDRQTDLIFLNINEPRRSNIDLLKNQSDLPAIIITTAYQRHIIDNCELDIADYLLKPFSFDQFKRAVQSILDS